MSTIFRDPVDVKLLDQILLQFNQGADSVGNIPKCDLLDGWDDSPEPTVVTASFGYNDGVVAAERFPYKEKYIEFGGYVHTTSRLQAQVWKQKLKAALNPNTELVIVRQGPIPMQHVIRVASKVEFPRAQDLGEQGFRWLCTIMAPWPFKTSPSITEEEAGVFSGSSFYRVYNATTFKRTYSPTTFSRVYYPDTTAGDQAGVETRRNYAPNPSFEVDATTGLTAYTKGAPTSPARTRVADVLPIGGGGFSLNLSASMSAVANADQMGYYFDVTAAPGDVFSIGAYLRMVSGQTGATSRLHAEWLNSSNVAVFPSFASPATIPLTQTTYVQRKSEGQVAPAGTAKLRVYMWVASGTVAGVSTARFDMIQVEKAATLGTYFDGSTSPSTVGDTTYSYGWDGTAGISQSIETSVVQQVAAQPIPDTIEVVNNGDADSYPEIEIQGPLLAGTWQLINETTGEAMSFDMDLSSGVELVIDNLEKIANIGETTVDYYLRGDWIRLVPGSNIIRLVTAEPNPDARVRVRVADTWR